MNILVITPLYPSFVGQSKSEVTYAVHYFVREWIKEKNNVIVINSRMYYPEILSVTKKMKKLDLLRSENMYKLDNVIVKRLSIVKYPKFLYSKKSVNKAVNSIKITLEKENFKPDCIVCHMMNPTLVLGEKIKSYYRAPLSCIVHSGDLLQLKSKVFLSQFKTYSKSIDSYGFRSNSIKKEFTKYYSEFLQGKLNFLVASGVESKYIIHKNVLEEKIKRPLKKIIIVASLIKRKNIDTVIRAVEILSKRYSIELTIIGKGSEEENLKSLVRTLNIEDIVKFRGEISREDTLIAIEESDIFSMVSRQETLGLVYIEAMAKGCIVIGSKNEGIDGIIIDNKNGYLVNSGDVNELKDKLEEILNLSESDKELILKSAYNTVINMTQKKVSEVYLENLRRTTWD